MPTATVSIPGIHCEGCVKLITDVTQDTPGVERVHVDQISKTVVIDHSDAFDFEAWKTEIQSLNPDYTVVPVS